VAITADWATARATSAAGQLPAMFSDLGVSHGDDQSAETPVDADAALNAMRQAPEAERVGLLRGHLHDIAAIVLRLDPADFSDEENLSGLGIDSLMAVEVKQRIDAMLRVDVSVLDLLQGVTVAELAGRILPLLRLDTKGDPEPGDHPEAEPALASDSQFDEELEQLLAQATPDELEALLAELEQDSRANLTGGMDDERRS
jgi:acyl carrier protein